MMETLNIYIPNFEKYNPSSKFKNKKHNWFRLQNTFIHDGRVMKLTPVGFKTYLSLLCLCSQSDSSSLSYCLKDVSRLSCERPDRVLSSLHTMHELGLIQVLNFSTPPENSPIRTNERTNEHTENSSSATPRNKKSAVKVEERLAREAKLDAIYRAYPKRPGTGKGPGLLSLARQLLTDEELKQCLLAANNYRNYCESKQTEPQFIKTFKVWCGSLKNQPWREWIEATHTQDLSRLGFIEG